MSYEEICEYAMELIANAGTAKSLFFEAIEFAKNNEMDKKEEAIKNAENYLDKAHEIQTNLIFKEADASENIHLNLVMVHAQDYLTMALMAKDNAKYFIYLIEKGVK